MIAILKNDQLNKCKDISVIYLLALLNVESKFEIEIVLIAKIEQLTKQTLSPARKQLRREEHRWRKWRRFPDFNFIGTIHLL